MILYWLWTGLISLVTGLICLFVGALFHEFRWFTRILDPIKRWLIKKGKYVDPYYTNEEFFNRALNDCDDHFFLISSDLSFMEGDHWKKFGESLLSGLISLNARGKAIKILVTTQNPKRSVVSKRIKDLIEYTAKLCPYCDKHEKIEKDGDVFKCSNTGNTYNEPLESSFGLDSIGNSIFFHHVDEALYLACWNGKYSGSMIKLDGNRVIRKYDDENILGLVDDYFKAVGGLQQTTDMAKSIRNEIKSI